LKYARHDYPGCPSRAEDEDEEHPMSVAKVTEIIASSKKSFEDAVRVGVARADKTLKNVKGAWIESQKVIIEKGKITEYRVTMRVTFVLKD
jgi:flavin-binding protein dodecin